MARTTRRIPLSSWSDQGLHATARRLRNLALSTGITRKQDWLLTSLINEMEFRYHETRAKRRLSDPTDWVCWGCDLCRVDVDAMPGQQRLVYVPPRTSV